MDELNVWMEGACYIGDPCYVFTDSQWDKIMEETNVFGAGDNTDIKFDGTFFVDGIECAVADTAYGDGVYDVRVNGEFLTSIGVDAGCIAIIPINAIPDSMLREACRLGVIVDQGYIPVSAENGVFNFGAIRIDTN